MLGPSIFFACPTPLCDQEVRSSACSTRPPQADQADPEKMQCPLNRRTSSTDAFQKEGDVRAGSRSSLQPIQARRRSPPRLFFPFSPSPGHPPPVFKMLALTLLASSLLASSAVAAPVVARGGSRMTYCESLLSLLFHSNSVLTFLPHSFQTTPRSDSARAVSSTRTRSTPLPSTPPT